MPREFIGSRIVNPNRNATDAENQDYIKRQRELLANEFGQDYVDKRLGAINARVGTQPAPGGAGGDAVAEQGVAKPVSYLQKEGVKVAPWQAQGGGGFSSQYEALIARANQPSSVPEGTPDLSRFDKLKQQVGQRFGAQQQQAEDAIKRRFASMGGLNTGAYLKQLENVGESVGRQREEAMQGVDFQAAAEGQRQKELAQAQKFQSEEAAKGRLYAAGEAGIGREFSARQADLAKQFERENLAVDVGFRNQLADFDRFKTLKQLDMAEREFSRDTETINFNKDLANRYLSEYGKNEGILGLGQAVPKGPARDVADVLGGVGWQFVKDKFWGN